MQVVAHMAETYWTAANQRLTSILVNDVLKQDGIDAWNLGNGRFVDTPLVGSVAQCSVPALLCLLIVVQTLVSGHKDCQCEHQ